MKRRRPDRHAARRMAPPPGVEAKYVRAMRALFASAHEHVVAAVMAHHGGARADAIHAHSVSVDRVEVQILAQVPAKVGQIFDAMAKPVAMKPPPPSLAAITARGAGIQDVVTSARDANIKLVEDALRDYAQDVRDVFDDPENFGLAPAGLKSLLVDRGNVSASRAELIARDQTLKLNAKINETHQTSAGVTSYVWSTSGDERVREEHAALAGETFDWSSPPEPGHPGEDYQCRCVALPVMPEFDAVDKEFDGAEAAGQSLEEAAPEAPDDAAPAAVNQLAAPDIQSIDEVGVHAEGMRPESLDIVREQRAAGEEMRPIEISQYGDEGPELIDGRHRLAVARELGDEDIAAKIRIHTSEGDLVRMTTRRVKI